MPCQNVPNVSIHEIFLYIKILPIFSLLAVLQAETWENEANKMDTELWNSVHFYCVAMYQFVHRNLLKGLPDDGQWDHGYIHTRLSDFQLFDTVSSSYRNHPHL